MKRNRSARERASGRENRASGQGSIQNAWRVFCAVELPTRIADLAAEHIQKLRHEFPDVLATWNRDGRFHLTLKFLGNIEIHRVADLSAAAERATAQLTSFSIIIEGAGAFPPNGQPRVIWIGIKDPSGHLEELQNHLEDECKVAGFAREERKFSPHLTLARIRNPKGARELALTHQKMGFEPVEMKVTSLNVFRSELSPAGSKYTLISEHKLASPTGNLHV
jgi:2'-5' RNA ligase